jgi:hypothetical protein
LFIMWVCSAVLIFALGRKLMRAPDGPAPAMVYCA